MGDASPDDWLRAFEARHGRPLRVLHIGNIANNAYNNAKIQRGRGIEADVACYEYWHVMGCPEWEDADFRGEVDETFPDWRSVDLRGFRRPPWFAQGRIASCQRYLLAYRRGEGIRIRLQEGMLRLDGWLRCRTTLPALVAATALGIERPTTSIDGTLERLAVPLSRKARRARLRVRELRSRLARRRSGDGNGENATATNEDPLTLRFRELFPDRARPLTRNDCAVFLPGLPGWRRLFREYDVIQGYAIDPIIPLLADETRYAAYEHGTLRNIPFEDTAEGRMCALGYREAAVVFVTNSDVLKPARRLGLDEEQLVFLPHAVDSDKLLRFAEANRALGPAPGSHATFFSPTRQDWVSGHPDWSKGNDRMIRALALARERGYDCRLVLVAWGRDLEASRDLIAELELAEHVEWVAPMRKHDLWKRYLTSHAVVDQFLTPAIGGVTFEAMALGRRVVTALDPVVTEEFFGERPPVLVAETPEEIAAALCRVAADPADEAGLGEAARDWFRRYHSAERIVALQVAAYARMLGESSPDARADQPAIG